MGSEPLNKKFALKVGKREALKKKVRRVHGSLKEATPSATRHATITNHLFTIILCSKTEAEQEVWLSEIS